ncbi:MAG TPA: hypothetical protein VK422_03590 [Pyrinomonadaceae bacterium]|nr:hypothetical protein [Pyrinomonadaceae bacterium]
MNLCMTVQAEQQALLGFAREGSPRGVGATSEINGEGLHRRVEVVKSQGRFVAAVAAPFAAAAFLGNQQSPSSATALLLGDIILVFVVCGSVLAAARTEHTLSAR